MTDQSPRTLHGPELLDGLGRLAQAQPVEATALLARLDAVPSVGHLDSADLGWVRPVLHDLLDENRRLRDENEQLADLDAAATRRAELRAERDRAVTRWHDEHKRAEKAEAVLADVAGYLAAIHRHAARHDVLAANLGCAGCELLARIESGSAP